MVVQLHALRAQQMRFVRNKTNICSVQNFLRGTLDAMHRLSTFIHHTYPFFLHFYGDKVFPICSIGRFVWE